MATLKLDGLNLRYGGEGGTHAVRDVDLAVGEGEFCVFLGPSGCGKTSTLRMIAGLETPTGGEIRLDGRVINHLYPGERDIAMVFQSYALYPHLSVRGHFELPLKAQKVPKAERDRRVAETAALLQVGDLLDAKPRHLSGGQAQRVAIGRALIRQPKLFLLDEPLTSLDARLRLETRGALKRLQRDLGITTIYVTHDQEEALSLADTIVIMHDGRIQQVASSRELYGHPANRFVAGFVGTPPMNFVDVIASPTATGGLELTAVGVRLPVSAEEVGGRVAPGETVTVGVRPEDLLIDSAAAEGGGARGRVVVVEPQGDERIVSVALDTGSPTPPVWKVRAPKSGNASTLAPGVQVSLASRPRGIRLFDPRTEERLL